MPIYQRWFSQENNKRPQRHCVDSVLLSETEVAGKHMALDQKRLESAIVAEMEKQGANAGGEYSWVQKMAQAISTAVIHEITANAKAIVASGNSAGSWPVE